MTYYMDVLSHCNITNSIDEFKDGIYKYFVPVASIYQKGIGILVKGSLNAIHTMQPFRIGFDTKETLDFTDSESSLTVPPDLIGLLKVLLNQNMEH